VRFLREHWVYFVVPLAVVVALVLALLAFGGDTGPFRGYEL
jgi:hypothetical protein